jgi:hypothetical protein
LRNAYCMIMPTVFVEPFGGAGVEAMLTGTPLLAPNYAVFQETVVPGVTGFLCNTLGDWLDGIRAVAGLDRAEVARVARSRFSLQVIFECLRSRPAGIPHRASLALIHTHSRRLTDYRVSEKSMISSLNSYHHWVERDGITPHPSPFKVKSLASWPQKARLWYPS